MARMDKVYKLEKETQFWEISVNRVMNDKISNGSSTESFSTSIRAGKKGCKGRKYPSKVHVTFHKAQQFALQQVNAKIMQGFDPVDRPKYKCELLRTPSIGAALRAGGGPFMLKRMCSVSRKWRKPPKKQDTVRKIARQRTDTGRDGTPPCATSSKLSENSPRTTLQKQDTVILASAKPSTKWRKPHKKQSTIRRTAKAQSVTRKAESLRKVLF